MSNTAVRLATGFIGIPIILAFLYLGPPVGYFALAGAAMLIGAMEFFSMTHPDDRPGRVLGSVLTVAVYATLIATRFGHHHGAVTTALLALLPTAVLFFALGRPSQIPTALPRATALVFGPIYLGAPMAALALLRTVGTPNEGAGLVIVALCTAWMSDTAAYFTGKGLKGPKLYPAVSPNKTWSGAIGGLSASAMGAVIAHYSYLPTLPLVKGVLVAAVAGAVGQAGDFCESLLKRSAGVKDSGGFLPGHGGILDRIDALLFSVLVVWGALETGFLKLG